jgi:nucleoside-diphosphate-sugar epimerase
MTKALVTGAAGMLGSHVVDSLLEQGHYVIGLDNLSRGKIENLQLAKRSKHFAFLTADVRDPKAFDQIPPVEIIFHLAAIVSPRAFYEMPVETFEVNAVGTRNVLEYARKSEVNRVVYASSSEIYGHPPRIPTDETSLMILDPPQLTTRWSYATSKLAGEYLALAYGKEWFDIVILRYANVYGPRDRGTEHVIPYLIASTIQNKPITLHDGADMRTRSFLFVTDCAEATILACSKGHKGSVLNIGSSEEITILQLTERIFKLCKNRVNVSYDKLPPGDPERRLLDISAAEKVLGFKPRVTLDEGLKKTKEWIESNRGQK